MQTFEPVQIIQKSKSYQKLNSNQFSRRSSKSGKKINIMKNKR